MLIVLVLGLVRHPVPDVDKRRAACQHGSTSIHATVSQTPSAARSNIGNDPHRRHDPLEGVSVDGMIATGARRSRISSAFEPVIAQAVAQALHGQHSLYVYGSVATGMARLGSSDVDLVTIGLDPASAAAMARQLGAAFPGLCRGVEVGPAQRSDYEGSSDEAYGNRVFLRHYCVHLAGPDVGHGLPDFPADAAAARGFNGDIGLGLDRWRMELARKSFLGSLGRRVARKTLLAVAGLVSIHDCTWTTDRAASARRWGLIKPEVAAALQQLVALSNVGTAGSPSRSEVQGLLDGVVADVVDDFKSRIGLWRLQAPESD